MDSDFPIITKGSRTVWRGKAIQGLILLVAGLTPFLALSGYESSRHFTPVNIAVPLHPATIRMQPFTINYPGTYTIDYRVQRTIPYQRLNCLLGIENIYPERCTEGQPKVKATWELNQNGKSVASGHTDAWEFDGSSQTYLEAGIGRVYLPSGGYELQVTIRNDLQALAATNPRLVLEIHPGETEWFILAFGATMFFGVPFVLVGLWKTGAAIMEGVGWRRV